jgi:hypothetical protein
LPLSTECWNSGSGDCLNSSIIFSSAPWYKIRKINWPILVWCGWGYSWDRCSQALFYEIFCLPRWLDLGCGQRCQFSISWKFFNQWFAQDLSALLVKIEIQYFLDSGIPSDPQFR